MHSFQDAASKRARDHTLKDDLKIATAVVEKLGSPWNPQKWAENHTTAQKS